MLTAAWVVLMGGNYAVLRDNISLLPWVTAAVLFVSCIFIGINTRAIKLPIWYGPKNATNRRRWIMNIIVLLCCLVPVGLSGMLNWWGPILQIVAVIAGLILGRYSGRQMRAVPCTLGVMFVTVIAILMQSELWRFGQLGNLTPIHLLWVLGTGIVIAAAMAINLVPIFIAGVVAAFISFGLSVWHAESISGELGNWMLAWAIILFGVLIDVATITAIGIVWIALPENTRRQGIGFLL